MPSKSFGTVEHAQELIIARLKEELIVAGKELAAARASSARDLAAIVEQSARRGEERDEYKRAFNDRTRQVKELRAEVSRLRDELQSIGVAAVRGLR